MTPTSLGERLLATRNRYQRVREETFPVLGDELQATYRGLTYKQSREIGKRHEGTGNEVEREIDQAAESLAVAGVKCEAHIDGEAHELPAMGLALAQALGMDGPENDVQAVRAIYPTDRAIIEAFQRVDALSEAGAAAALGEMQGNLQAVGS